MDTDIEEINSLIHKAHNLINPPKIQAGDPGYYYILYNNIFFIQRRYNTGCWTLW